MRRKFTIVFAILATTFFLNSQNATFSGFLNGGGSTGADRAADVITDASGNIYTANTFAFEATFNGLTFNGAPKGSGASYDNSLLITKLNSSKVTQWSIYSNVGAVNPTALAITSTGELIVTGNMRAILNTAGQTTTANLIDGASVITTFTGLGNSTAVAQSFVAKFSTSGSLLWVKEINSDATKTTSVLTDALAVDDEGNIYLTGNFTTKVTLPYSSPITLTSLNTTKSAFIAKLDGATGTALWHQVSTGGIVSEILPALTFGDDGYIYAAGNYQNNATPTTPTQSITIGGKSFIPSVGANLTLIKLAKDGTVQYIQDRPSVYVTSIKNVRTKDIVVNNGKAVVVGSFNGNDGGIQFSSGALTCTTTSLNGFLAAFKTSDGTDVWQKAILSPAIVEVLGAVIGYDQNLYTFGYHYNKLGSNAAGDVVFGNGKVLTDATNTTGDLHLASFNISTGVTQEVHLVGKGPGSETANSLCAFNNKLYMIGSSNSTTITYENAGTYSTTGAFDFYLVDYTVTNPGTGVNNSKFRDNPVLYFNNATKCIEINIAEKVAFVKIYDVTGRNVLTQPNQNTSFKIDVNNFNSGIYVVNLIDRQGVSNTQRILIQ